MTLWATQTSQQWTKSLYVIHPWLVQCLLTWSMGGANTLSLGWINSQLQFHVMVNGPKTQLPYRSIIIRVRKQIYWRNNVAPIGIDELFLTHSGSTMVSNFSKEKVVTTDTERTTDMTFKGLQLWQEYVHPEWVFSCNDIGVHLQCHIKAWFASFLLVTVKWARDWAIALSKEKLNSNLYELKQVTAVFQKTPFWNLR